MRPFTTLLAAGAIAFSTIALLHRPAHAAAPLKLADKTASKETADAARGVVAKAIDHAAAGDLRSLLKECVGQHDRDRIEKSLSKSDEDKYKADADKFRGEWKKKYGGDFAAAAHSRFANSFTVDPGKDDSRADIKIEGSGVKEPVYLHVHKEKSGEWVIALPDSVTGDNFASSMADQMKSMVDQKDWPNSVDEGYRHAAAHLLRPLQYEKQ